MKISEEIHILQALNTKDKGKVPTYLKHRDKGFVYFPNEDVMPFLHNWLFYNGVNVLLEYINLDLLRVHKLLV